jgi:hypothetical protein
LPAAVLEPEPQEKAVYCHPKVIARKVGSTEAHGEAGSDLATQGERVGRCDELDRLSIDRPKGSADDYTPCNGEDQPCLVLGLGRGRAGPGAGSKQQGDAYELSHLHHPPRI